MVTFAEADASPFSFWLHETIPSGKTKAIIADNILPLFRLRKWSIANEQSTVQGYHRDSKGQDSGLQRLSLAHRLSVRDSFGASFAL